MDKARGIGGEEMKREEAIAELDRRQMAKRKEVAIKYLKDLQLKRRKEEAERERREIFRRQIYPQRVAEEMRL